MWGAESRKTLQYKFRRPPAHPCPPSFVAFQPCATKFEPRVTQQDQRHDTAQATLRQMNRYGLIHSKSSPCSTIHLIESLFR